MFRRCLLQAAVGFIFFILAVVSLTAYGQQTTTPESMVLTVFPDGAADVEYRVVVDQNAPRITLPLIGASYDNIIVADGDGRPLDFRLDQNNITVDTIGEAAVTVTYTTHGLTTATGALWTIALDSPVAFTVVFLGGATIVSVDQPPIGVNLCGTGALACDTTLTMPAGHSEISYILAASINGQSALPLSKTTSSSSPTSSPQQQGSFLLIFASIGIVAVATIVGLVIHKKRSESKYAKAAEILRPKDA